MQKLSENTLFKLRRINQKLKELQDKLLAEAIKHDKALQLRVEDKNDSLDDYEIELHIEFYLKEEHLDYKENYDNIVTKINECLKGISQSAPQYPWRWSDNHNEFKGFINHPMRNEYHCWWFHCLYDHSHLEIGDILSIGSIWSDIVIYHQYKDILG
ncbi:MAG: hypothetical protein KU29_05135 [Sulfurovum sp. FS06-10]|nr:MAG: hypothetical protein KU29_05135 [Sulfurovum sp. FS06-10]